MNEHERASYKQWLAQPAAIMALLEKYFRTERLFNWTGKAGVGSADESEFGFRVASVELP